MFVVKLGKRLLIREMIGLLSCLQVLIASFLDNHIFPNLTFYGMTIPEADYMNYAVPANFMFILGLHFYKFNKNVDYEKLFFNIKKP